MNPSRVAMALSRVFFETPSAGARVESARWALGRKPRAPLAFRMTARVASSSAACPDRGPSVGNEAVPSTDATTLRGPNVGGGGGSEGLTMFHAGPQPLVAFT